MKERTGSSAHAIAKYLEDKHSASLPANYKKMLSVQLRRFAAKGKLVKVKASYKLSDATKDSPKAKVKPTPKPAKESRRSSQPNKRRSRVEAARRKGEPPEGDAKPAE